MSRWGSPTISERPQSLYAPLIHRITVNRLVFREAVELRQWCLDGIGAEHRDWGSTFFDSYQNGMAFFRFARREDAVLFYLRVPSRMKPSDAK